MISNAISQGNSLDPHLALLPGGNHLQTPTYIHSSHVRNYLLAICNELGTGVSVGLQLSDFIELLTREGDKNQSANPPNQINCDMGKSTQSSGGNYI